MTSPRYRETLEHLFGLRRFGMHPGLDVIRAILRALDDPQKEFPAIHVAGSKGKGSVSAIAAELLGAHGRRTGLFTSPHLQSYRERMQIDRQPISHQHVVEGVERVAAIVEELLGRGLIDRPATFFEVTTALALDWFARERVDCAVIEVGIGGRLDSTNVLRAPVGIITTIELEHTELLGSTLEAIAREKGGILQPGMHAMVGSLPSSPLREIDRIAGPLGVPVWRLGREVRVTERSLSAKGQRFSVSLPTGMIEGLDLPLQGTFQPSNAALALAGVDRFASATGLTLEPRKLRIGMARVRWKGRLELVRRRPDLILDVAHTPESAKAIAESLLELRPFLDAADNAILFGCLADKRVEPMLDAYSTLARSLVVTPIASSRSASPSDLVRAGAGKFATVVRARSAAEGLALARAATKSSGFTLVVGSDYLAGETLNHLEGKDPDEPDLSDPGQLSPSPVNWEPPPVREQVQHGP